MEDVIGKIAVIIIGVFLLFYIPVAIIAVKQDTIAQNYIDNAVSEFVDNARTTGKITDAEYEKMVEKIYTAHTPCNISIYHGATYVTPDPANPGQINRHSEYYSEADILPIIFDETAGEDYELKDGDYIKVVVYNETPTLGAKMLGNFLISYDTTKTLFTSYGGYVGNNIENKAA